MKLRNLSSGVCVLLVIASFVLTPLVRANQAQYALQVGAWGDEASKGNMGVGVESLTRVYDVFKPDIVHAFWVGDNLANGAFIQFGYELFGPDYYCLYGETIGDHTNCQGSSEMIESGDARWFWEYWPNSSVADFYGEIGPAGSAGPNGTWHHYQIWPNVANGWNFVLDGQTVWSFNRFQSTTSKDPALVAAEEVTGLPSAGGNLGPVEFRNLEYLTQTGWQQVRSLTAISGCSAISPNCGPIPYGVASLGANDIIAGAGVQKVLNDQFLWTLQYNLTIVSPLPVSGAGSYDVGSTAYFSINGNAIMIDSRDLWIFIGWYDENGNLITLFGSGSIVMDAPHTVEAKYLHL